MIIKQIRSLKNDRGFFKKVITISIPIVVQQLLNNVLSLVDTLMIGQLGESTIAAVGLANKVFFVYSLLTFGICSGAGVLQSQFWGKKDIRSIQRVQGIALLLCFAAAAFFTIAAIAAPEAVMRIFTNSQSAISIGASYLKIVAWSYLPTAVTLVFVSTMRSCGRVKAPVVISTVAIISNVFLNYVLIFGKFGFPRLDAPGAAIATTIARIIECAALLLIVYATKSPAAASPRALFGFKTVASLFFKTATPVIFNEFMWGLGVTIYSLVYGRMGDSATAAITVTQSIEQVAQVVFMGLASATAIILGNELGAGKLEDAKRHSGNFIFLQCIFSVLTMLVFAFVRGGLIRLFGLSGEVAQLANLCFIVFMLYLIPKNFNLVNIVGVLRSGGDTKAALLLDCTGVWLIGIPMAFLGGMLLKQPIYTVYAMVLVEEIYKMVLGMIRYLSGKWCRNIVDKA